MVPICACVSPDEIENLAGWLTTVVTRICLNVLRSRRHHPEEPLEVHVPDPVIDRPDAMDPEPRRPLGFLDGPEGAPDEV